VLGSLADAGGCAHERDARQQDGEQRYALEIVTETPAYAQPGNEQQRRNQCREGQGIDRTGPVARSEPASVQQGGQIGHRHARDALQRLQCDETCCLLRQDGIPEEFERFPALQVVHDQRADADQQGDPG